MFRKLTFVGDQAQLFLLSYAPRKEQASINEPTESEPLEPADKNHQIPKCCVQKKGAHIFQKSTSHLKILDVREVPWNKFHADDPRPLAATEQNLVATPIWWTEFVHPWIRTLPPPQGDGQCSK
jgi:hypothetical protein